MRPTSLISPLLCLLAALAALLPSVPALGQPGLRCFPETGHCIGGSIRTYWERNGGLAIFGYPITEQRQETVEGRSLQVQWFERDRLEIQQDGTITAGRLGAQLLELQGRPWQEFPKDQQHGAPGCRYFEVTGFNVCSSFLAYWQSGGGLERYGYPISPVIGEVIEGKVYSVQYFERRRLEDHPENTPPYNVLLGLLGSEVYGAQGGGQSITPPAVPPAAGATWQWVSFTDAVQQVRIENPANYTISFASGNASIRADCNRANAAYTARDDGSLSVILGATTRAVCPPGSRGDLFLNKLSNVTRYFFQGDRLILQLRADGGTLEFTRQ